MELADKQGWSQAELARRIHLDKSHLSRLLKGERNWQPDQLQRVAAVFAVALADLVMGTDAEGLVDATRDAHAANKILTDQLAELASVNQAQSADLAAVHAERDALRKDLDEARAQLQRATQDLRNRPARQDYDALRADRDDCMGRISRLQHEVVEFRRNVRALRTEVVGLRTSLTKAHAQVQTNFQAYEYWRKQAESNGATLKGIAVAAAGVGLIKLLSGSNGSDDDTYDG